MLLVLVPGVGREVNGSVRWIALGPLRLQVSEPAKLLMLLYLAGLSNISPELYEAADIDGASRWQRFWSITWPQLAPTTSAPASVNAASG